MAAVVSAYRAGAVKVTQESQYIYIIIKNATQYHIQLHSSWKVTVPVGAVPGTVLRCSWRGVDFLAKCPELVGPGQRFVVVLTDAANDNSAKLDPDLPAVDIVK